MCNVVQDSWQMRFGRPHREGPAPGSMVIVSPGFTVIINNCRCVTVSSSRWSKQHAFTSASHCFHTALSQTCESRPIISKPGPLTEPWLAFAGCKSPAYCCQSAPPLQPVAVIFVVLRRSTLKIGNCLSSQGVTALPAWQLTEGVRPVAVGTIDTAFVCTASAIRTAMGMFPVISACWGCAEVRHRVR